MRYEYACINRPYVVNRENEDIAVTDWLNIQASHGWRLIAIVDFVYYFERQNVS